MTDTYGGTGGPTSRDENPAPYPLPQYPQPQYPQPYGVPPAGVTPPGQYPYGEQPYAQYAPHLYGRPGYGPPGFGMRDPDARPATVVAAGIVALVTIGLVMLTAVFSLIVLVVARAALGIEDDPFFGNGSTDALAIGLPVLMLVWCVAATVLTVRALRRSNSGRIGLVASSSVTIVVCLAAVVASVFGAVLVALAAIAVIVLMFTGGAGEWYLGRRTSPSPINPAEPPLS